MSEFYSTYFITSCNGNLICYTPLFETDKNNSLDWLCRQVSHIYAFNDCTDEEIVLIVHKGHELEYVGWQPDMLFEYKDKMTGETVWEGYFPSWDH